MVNLYDFQERFPEAYAAFMAAGCVNPLEAFENTSFDATTDDERNYRDRAIDECIENDLSFHSTHNTFWACAERFLVAKCPRCRETMKIYSGTSYPRTATLEFRCENEACERGLMGGRPQIKLTLAHDGIDVRLPERPERPEGDE